MRFEQPKKMEPITEDKIVSLFAVLSPLQRVSVQLYGKIDFETGMGIFGPQAHCLWTTEGKRLTVMITDDLDVIISCSRNKDPLYQELKKKK